MFYVFWFLFSNAGCSKYIEYRTCTMFTLAADTDIQFG